MLSTFPLRPAVLSALSFGLALGVACLIATVAAVPPIVPALAASVVLAGCEFFQGRSCSQLELEPTQENVWLWGLTFLMAWVITAGLALILPSGTQFICEPLVPWRISIALFGAFFSAWMIAAMRSREDGAKLEPLLRVVLLWIAPFYGFFYAPWFLALSLAVPCADRPQAQVAIAALAVAVSAHGGYRVGIWMYGRAL
jgi:hypothetical protein